MFFAQRENCQKRCQIFCLALFDVFGCGPFPLANLAVRWIWPFRENQTSDRSSFEDSRLLKSGVLTFFLCVYQPFLDIKARFILLICRDRTIIVGEKNRHNGVWSHSFKEFRVLKVCGHIWASLTIFNQCHVQRRGRRSPVYSQRQYEHDVGLWSDAVSTRVLKTTKAEQKVDNELLATATHTWAASIRHLMWKHSATSSRSFGQKLSHHVMPKVLVLKAQGRHVMW